MKQTELKRTVGLKQGKPLRSDSQLRRTGGLARTKPKPKAKIPKEIRERVMRRSNGICIRPSCEERAVHIHHFLDESTWPELAKIEDNLGGTCPGCNYSHHFAPNGKLPVSVLPQCTRRLVAKIGPRAQAYIARHYEPEPGGTGSNERTIHG